MSPINKLQYQLRRELWENKGGVLWTPAVIAVALCVLIVLALSMGRFSIVDGHLDVETALNLMNKHGWSEDIDEPVKIVDFASETLRDSDETDIGLNMWRASPRSAMMAFQHTTAIGFEVIALIVAVVYLLGALFNDRKDRSILFWKSLPISETSNVLSKLVFAGLAIPLAALVFSIPVQLIGGLAIAWVYSLTDTFTFFNAFSELSLISVFFMHTIAIAVFALKSLPLYAWLLFASAVSKRHPLLIAIILPLAIAAIEWLIFGTDYFSNFVASLFFSDQFVFNDLQNEGESVLRVMAALIDFSLVQVLHITVIATLFIAGAVWCRNNRYEI